MQRLTTDGQIVSRQVLEVSPAMHHCVRLERVVYLVDHLKVVGFIATPLGNAGRRYPVLLYNRGGYRKFSRHDAQSLERVVAYAARGYVVLAAQYRGTDGGEGQDGYGGADVKDVLALAWLAESLPEADAEQLYMFGHSRGGMMTYLCIKHGLPLRAAATVAAPTDLAQRPLPHALETLYAGLFGEPAEHPAPYRERSALCWPEQLRVPLLIQHGGQDKRVDPQDSARLAARLTELGYPHTFILYPDGDHFLHNVQEQRDRAIFDWFQR